MLDVRGQALISELGCNHSSRPDPFAYEAYRDRVSGISRLYLSLRFGDTPIAF